MRPVEKNRVSIDLSYIPNAMPQVLLFTQPGCLSCELMRLYLEAREIPFEERDITDPENRRVMTETHASNETPTLVIDEEVITGFDPALLDQLLDPTPSSDSVPES
jgi:glutaredoxin